MRAISGISGARQGTLLGTALATMALLVAACSGATDNSTPDPVRTVASVSVTPSQHVLFVGDSVDLTARALDDQGAVIEGKTVVWSTEADAIASVAPNGRTKAVGAGLVHIRATIDGKVGSAELVVHTRPATPVAWLEVTPATLSVEEGDSHTLVAVAHDAQGNILVGRAITWTTSDASVAEVDAEGKLTAKKIGTSTITAISEGKVASVALTVTTPAVAFIGITPTLLVIDVGQARQLSAVLKDARGNVLTGRTVTWRSDTSNATVSATGLVMGMHPGYATIIATAEGKSAGIAATISATESYAYDLLYFRRNDPSGAEIFIMTLGSTNGPTRLNAGNVSSQPTSNPSGTRIAFAVSQIDLATHEQIADIFAVDRNGMNMKRLTTASGYDDFPAWSPDGTRIAYRHYETNGRMDVWVMNADGTSPVNLTAEMPDDSRQGLPAWSPDGSRIAFAAAHNDFGYTTASIWTMRADGSDKRQLTSTTDGYDSAPTWSSDGQRIAFIRNYGGDADITIVSAAGGATTRIAIPGTQWSPCWSPDGRYIAYSQMDENLAYNVYTMAPSGLNIRLRTINPEWGGGLKPVWIRKQ
jgi:Tol biopolymer transport system component/uncharacterized protein YjdB